MYIATLSEFLFARQNMFFFLVVRLKPIPASQTGCLPSHGSL